MIWYVNNSNSAAICYSGYVKHIVSILCFRPEIFITDIQIQIRYRFQMIQHKFVSCNQTNDDTHFFKIAATKISLAASSSRGVYSRANDYDRQVMTFMKW